MSHLAETFDQQVQACRELGSPMYAELLAAMTTDIYSNGPTSSLLAGHEDDPGDSALALRLLGGLHALVLRGAAPALASYYPSVGGTWDLAAAWPLVRETFEEHGKELRSALDQAPQTNEVGRATALLGGLLHVADRFGHPVRLFEIGASAGLNLRADHFRYEWDRGSWGPDDSPVTLRDAWSGVLPPTGATLEVVERRGSDLAPVDPTHDDGRVRLTSYVWPDMAERLTRLRGAFEIADAVPVELARANALDAVDAIELAHSTVTVLWHSVMWQYLDEPTRSAIEDRLQVLGRTASADKPFAHLVLEPRRRVAGADSEFLVVLQTWPGGEERILATGAAHGVPTRWE